MKRYRNIRTGQIIPDDDEDSVFGRSTQWELLEDEATAAEPEVIHGDLLVKDYEAGSAEQVIKLVGAADLDMARAVLVYEETRKKPKARTTVVSAVKDRIKALEDEATPAAPARVETPPAA